MTNNKHVNAWVAEMAELTCPDKIVWITGDDAQTEALREEACSTGEIEKLNEEWKQKTPLKSFVIDSLSKKDN